MGCAHRPTYRHATWRDRLARDGPGGSRPARAETYSDTNEYDALILNLEIAVQRQGRKVDKARLARLIEDGAVDPRVKICAHILLEEKEEAATQLVKAVENNRAISYEVQKWAIFDSTPNRAWLKDSLSQAGYNPDIGTVQMTPMIGVVA